MDEPWFWIWFLLFIAATGWAAWFCAAAANRDLAAENRSLRRMVHPSTRPTGGGR